MMRHIAIQFIFQMGLLLYLQSYPSHFDVTPESTQHITIVFNTFVFCQVFNEINARSIDDHMDVFKGIEKNFLFLAIIAFTVVAQFGIVEYGGDFVRTVGLTQDQWIKTVLLASLSLPLGGLMRLVPVQDSASDFAEVTEEGKRLRKGSKSVDYENDYTSSFFLWLAVVGVLPLLCMQQFKEQWGL